MRIGGVHLRSIWLDESTGCPAIIDQTSLPFALEKRILRSLDEVDEAIRTMRVRGAPLIGATAAHGLALAAALDSSGPALARAREQLLSTRPTAVNLRWALDRVICAVESVPVAQRADRAKAEAVKICDEEVASCAAIGRFGFKILEDLALKKRQRDMNGPSALQILTHCNAGWLATVDWGTALAPIYRAHDAGLPIHVWVDETRPRLQGAMLTAFELREQGVPHTVIVDGAAGHLMQRGLVDVVIVGSDRTTAIGDVCNKIGTYTKALAAKANAVPFYVALPTSTIDWAIDDGLASIPIEERDPGELRRVRGRNREGRIESVELFDAESRAANPAFDVTPAEHVTGLLTEHGLISADRDALAALRRLIV